MREDERNQLIEEAIALITNATPEQIALALRAALETQNI